MVSWITKKLSDLKFKARKIFKKQPFAQESTDWKTCPSCQKISYKPDLFSNSYICECSFHFDLPPKLRLDSLFDSSYKIIELSKSIDPDPLGFEVQNAARDGYKYIEKIKKYRKVTNQQTALLCSSGTISGLSAVVVCFNPKFGGGRLGTAENEHFLEAARVAIQKKVDLWMVIYQSSGIDVHAGVTALAGMTKSVIAMNEIKEAGIPTFAIAARAVAGGTYASSFFMHDFIIIEHSSVENLLFSGRRVTLNILKSTDTIPDSFGRADGVMQSGLADICLENRKDLKQTVTKLAKIILKKEQLKISNEEAIEDRKSDIKISSAS